MESVSNIRIISVGSGSASVLKRLSCSKIKNIETLEFDNDETNYDKSFIQNFINGSDAVIIISCLGGETTSTISCEIAHLAKSLSVLTISLISIPFSFEGKQKYVNAINAMNEISKTSDCVITIKYDKILKGFKNTADVVLHEVWGRADDLIYNAICGLINLINENEGQYDDNLPSITLSFKNIGSGFFLYDNIRKSKKLKDDIQYFLSNINYNTNYFKLSHYIAINVISADLSPDEYSYIKSVISSIISTNTTFKIIYTRDKKLNDAIIIKMYFFGPSLDNDTKNYSASNYSTESSNIETSSIEDVVYINDIKELFPLNIKTNKDDTRIPSIVRYI